MSAQVRVIRSVMTARYIEPTTDGRSIFWGLSLDCAHVIERYSTPFDGTIPTQIECSECQAFAVGALWNLRVPR